MRLLAVLVLLAAACADWQRPALTDPYRADQPLIHEQALVGLATDGSAAAVQLIDAEGAPPQLELLVFDASGAPTRHVRAAPEIVARAVSRRLRDEGRKAVPLVGSVAAQEWPEGVAVAAREGFAPAAPVLIDPAHAVQLRGTPQSGGLSLLLRVAISDGDPRALTLLLGTMRGTERWFEQVELARQPIAGTPVAAAVWMAADALWLLSGSVADGEPLRRAIGLRRASLRRGEAQLHNARGIAFRAAGDLNGAEREFERAAAADARFFDAIYNAASVAAATGREDAALVSLRRAAQLDRRRLEVLGRDDESLARLRTRPDVRELLGMKRAPPDPSK